MCGKAKKSLEDATSRAWEKITKDPLHLEIRADYTPKIRLLVKDTSIFCGVSLDMRMSQLYLLMSIWFSNMQELPILFPFEKETVEQSSTNPDPPSDWPEYGTAEFVERLKSGGTANATFDMALCLKKLSLRCSYDCPGYFAKVPPTMSMMQSFSRDEEGVGISVELGNVVCSTTIDSDSLQSISIGATSFKVFDGRQSDKSFEQGIDVKNHRESLNSFVDGWWGLDCGRHTLVDGLPLPFQTTVFLTPDHRCLINLGFDMAEAALTDLALLWILLDYFGLYFKEPAYGHPAFEAEQLYQTANGCNNDNECMDIDFRLWMLQPHVVVPSLEDICVMVEATGFYYCYRSFGANYSSQEITAKDLGIVLLAEYMEPSRSRGLRQVSGCLNSCGVKTLVEGLSFSLHYGFNTSTNYTRFALRVPLTSEHFDRHAMDDIELSNIEPQPFSVPPPLVCKPFEVPSRWTTKHDETKIYVSHKYMKLASDILTAFVGPSQQEDSINKETASADSSLEDNAFSVTAHVERVKCVISMWLYMCLLSLLLVYYEHNLMG